MRKVITTIGSLLVTLCVVLNLFGSVAFAEEATDETVAKVIRQLEALDTLQEMQDKRSEYKVSGSYSEETAAEHEAARSGYEVYLENMFSARAAAKEAYNALTDEQKAQISSELTAVLSEELDTEFYTGSYQITQADDEYVYQLVFKKNRAYELSNHCTAPVVDIPQTLVLVDSTQYSGTWSPNGQYSYGQSNYDLAYCCDLINAGVDGTYYKRINLEDSSYYSSADAKHIRAIVQNSYPFLSLEQMKANLIAGGMDETVVSELTRGDVIAAVQFAIWSYSNMDYESIANSTVYGGTYDMNAYKYGSAFHDYTNELWNWWSTKVKHITYDSDTAYRVNELTNYLKSLEGVSAEEGQIVISEVEVARTEPVAGKENTYLLGLNVFLNNGSSDKDDIRITVSSYSENQDGSLNITGTSTQEVSGETKYQMTVEAKIGEMIKVVVEGTQYLEKGVYFYEPKGGRSVSQTLVGVAEGETRVKAENAFYLEESAEYGLHIYKKASDTGRPISDITFTVYKVTEEEGDTLSAVPDKEDIAKYQTEENKVGSVTKDANGYAAMDLDKGIYMVVEEHNTEKVKEPVAPFYISVPMADPITGEIKKIVAVYPKNVPIVPEEPQDPVIPDNPEPEVKTGNFTVLKYSADNKAAVLQGAKFQVFRPAADDDSEENTTIVECNGVEYKVVPVVVEGEEVILTTGEDGTAVSPQLVYGSYFLLEVQAPTGYRLLQEAVSVTVNSESNSTWIEISNKPRTVLPETGGMGTYGFVVAGIGLMGTAIVLANKRRNKKFHIFHIF